MQNKSSPEIMRITPKRQKSWRRRLNSTRTTPRPGIYWVGPSHWPDSLQDLAEGLRSIAVRAGGKLERKRFQPHVTLFRGCEVAPPAPSVFPRVPFDYSDFCLCESIQGRRGVTYQPLAHWDLSPLG